MWCWTLSQNTTSRMRLRNGRIAGNNERCIQGWWWPLGSKLVFDQMASPVQEIMVGSYRFLMCYAEQILLQKTPVLYMCSLSVRNLDKIQYYSHFMK
jgi:hypothetical protein